MSEHPMNEETGEQLSALMDGELPRDQLRFLLRRIDTDPGLMQVWSRYQVARGSLRRQIALPLRGDFAETLMQRIAQEALPVGRRRGATLLRWAGGGAIAAAVAVVALVATRPPQGENVPAALSSVAVVAPAAVPVSQDARPAPSPALVNFDYAQPASFDTAVPIPRYDIRHRYEANGAASVNGFGPYVLLTAPRPQQAAPNRQETPQP